MCSVAASTRSSQVTVPQTLMLSKTSRSACSQIASASASVTSSQRLAWFHVAVELGRLALLHKPRCVLLPLNAGGICDVEDVCVCDDNADDAYGREQKQGYENDVAQHRVEAVCAHLGVSRVSEHGGSVLLCVCWKSISFVAVS